MTAWDRRRGRERETYTLQGYSPVLGNRPPELAMIPEELLAIGLARCGGLNGLAGAAEF